MPLANKTDCDAAALAYTVDGVAVLASRPKVAASELEAVHGGRVLAPDD